MLYKQIKKFNKKKQLFCTPGHMGRMPRSFCAALDTTELDGTDNLYYPSGILKEAQENAAKIFGARELLFLTAGATQGIFAMLGAFRDKRVIVPRNSHKSVFEACQLFNIEPIFEGEEDDNSTNNECGESSNEGKKTTAAAARLVIYPDYYGNTIDINAVKTDCQKKGIPLLVDAAHGSHFGFSERLPQGANLFGDCVVMSAHKTLTALTQGAYLCVNNESLAEAVKKTYKNLATTSPSYLILASLDFAAQTLKKHGEKRYEKLFFAIKDFEAKLPKSIKFCKSDDFTRIVLEVENGFDTLKKLNKIGVFPEFADPKHVVFIVSIAHTPKDIRRLSYAINVLS